ncbi:unnamed protein product [[Candida] boidinii]|nr:unnamed protein product [[Candida] boidinii]
MNEPDTHYNSRDIVNCVVVSSKLWAASNPYNNPPHQSINQSINQTNKQSNHHQQQTPILTNSTPVT